MHWHSDRLRQRSRPARPVVRRRRDHWRRSGGGRDPPPLLAHRRASRDRADDPGTALGAVGYRMEVVAWTDKPLEASRGTAHMVRLARDARILVQVIAVRDDAMEVW